jgi:hypothetical protein
MRLRHLLPILLPALLAACGPPPLPVVAWDGRRGYDGSGDYGYDPAVSRAEATTYRAEAAATYPVPGPPGDPWGPYIREAAQRVGFPEAWVRAVMRQESGGRLVMADGSLVTSPAGAMGLMQIMPATWDRLRPQLGLGADPYEPRDNILAGTAYLKQMHDRFGSPNFLAAYNAGPDRVALYLTGAKILPDETETYVARITSSLGTWDGGGVVQDAADRAYDGGGLVTPFAPTGTIAGQQAAWQGR